MLVMPAVSYIFFGTRELSDPAALGDDQRDEMYGLLLEHTAR
jgi:hypothetical protein